MIEFWDTNITTQWGTYLLPLLSFILGIYITRRRFKKQKKQLRFSNDYFQGLNYLLNDEQDKALNIFIKLVETDWETIDTSLALGAIFRRKGEIDKAIKLHQNLLARPSLPQEYKGMVLLSLAKDYLQAGWLDRAENLFNEIVENEAFTHEAQECLMSIYEKEQDWEKAINIARRFQSKGNITLAATTAHYYCELSQKAHSKNDLKEAEALATQALNADKNCVRASILLADFAITRGRFQKAIRFLRQVEIQNEKLLPLALDKLVLCYRNTSNLNKALSYLRSLEQKHKNIFLTPVLTSLIEEIFSKEDALQYLIDSVHETPSLFTLNTLLQLQGPDTSQQKTLLPTVIEAITEKQPDYQCINCGYSANTHVWSCPSCHHWSSLIPQSL